VFSKNDNTAREQSEIIGMNSSPIIVIEKNKLSPEQPLNESSPFSQLRPLSSNTESMQCPSETGLPVTHKIDQLDWDNLTVKVRNLNFSYRKSKKTVTLLKDIDMSIPKSSMYAIISL